MLREAKEFLEARMPAVPSIAVVLGSGLGGFADELSDRVELSYADIPNWPSSTAIGHAGKLIFGRLNTVNIAVLSGRAHLYEGYSPARVTFGVRLLGLLGVKTLILTNAAGGINLDLQKGGLVLISDHINLQGINPLVGVNEDDLGPRFPDMTEAYCARYREIAKTTAAELGIPLSEGVYAALLGPSYETPAEIRYLRIIGADLVGMSTVPEVIVANHMSMKVLAISSVTNMAAGILPQKISHEDVLAAGWEVRDTLVKLLKAVIPKLEAEANRGTVA
jgi:purine-nucleoside phosphorylase